MAGSGRDELFRQQHGSRCCERRGGRWGAFLRCVKLTNGIEKSKVLYKNEFHQTEWNAGRQCLRSPFPHSSGQWGSFFSPHARPFLTPRRHRYKLILGLKHDHPCLRQLTGSCSLPKSLSHTLVKVPTPHPGQMWQVLGQKFPLVGSPLNLREVCVAKPINLSRILLSENAQSATATFLLLLRLFCCPPACDNFVSFLQLHNANDHDDPIFRRENYTQDGRCRGTNVGLWRRDCANEQAVEGMRYQTLGWIERKRQKTNRKTAIPSAPRPVDSPHSLPMGRHRRAARLFLCARLLCARLVYRYVYLTSLLVPHANDGTIHSGLRPRHLPPQPLPRLPPAQIRPLQRGPRQ